jgi:hypothetical protein
LFEGSSDEIKFERSTALLHVLERLVAEPPSTPKPTGVATDAVMAEAEAAGMEVEQMVEAANPQDTGISVETPLAPSAVALSSAPVAQLFNALRVERGADGSLRIEAPPQAASALASLFDGMARLLSAVGAASTGGGAEQQPPPMPS